MRMFKKIMLAVLIVFAVVFVNGCIYVFGGVQNRTMDKILHKEKVSLYEKCSIYTMHIAVYMFGWPLSPEAAEEVFKMSFPWNRGREIMKKNSYFKKSPTIAKAISGLKEGETKYIGFNGDIAYDLSNPDHRVALAVNPGYLSRRDGKICLKSPVTYPHYSSTTITVFGMKVPIHEGLFHYLEDIHWIHPYTLVWWCEEY